MKIPFSIWEEIDKPVSSLTEEELQKMFAVACMALPTMGQYVWEKINRLEKKIAELEALR